MFKLVVLSALLAFAVAKPSHEHFVGGLVQPIGYAAAVHTVPAAVSHSHSSRVDVHSAPVVTAYAAPAAYVHAAPIVKTQVVEAAPIVKTEYIQAAPIVKTVQNVPTAVSHQSRIDIHSKPVVATYAAHVPVAYSAPAVAYSAPAVVAAPAVAYAAPATVSHSHSSRVDVHSGKTVLAYSAPAVVAAGPALAYGGHYGGHFAYNLHV